MRSSQPCTAVALEASCIIPTSLSSLCFYSPALSQRAHTDTHALFPRGADPKVPWGPNGVKQTVNQLQGRLSRGGSARLDAARAAERRGLTKTHTCVGIGRHLNHRGFRSINIGHTMMMYGPDTACRRSR